MTDIELQRRCERVLHAPLIELPRNDPSAYDLVPVLIRMGVGDMEWVEIVELAEGRQLPRHERRRQMMGIDIVGGMSLTWQVC